jgi:hypothetical protein
LARKAELIHKISLIILPEWWSIAVMSSEILRSEAVEKTQGTPHPSLGINLAQGLSRKENVMTRALDVIIEIIRNPKPPFRKADDRPIKAQKHRYERRKIKEYIRLGDWGEEKTA